MPQDLFNSVALTIAWGTSVDVRDPEKQAEVVAEGVDAYRHFYTEDNFTPEALKASEFAKEAATIFGKGWTEGARNPEEAKLQWLSALMIASLKYQPDGRKKPWRILKGLRFSSLKSPPPDRCSQFMKDIQLYYIHLQMGRIPFVALSDAGPLVSQDRR